MFNKIYQNKIQYIKITCVVSGIFFLHAFDILGIVLLFTALVLFTHPVLMYNSPAIRENEAKKIDAMYEAVDASRLKT